MTAPIPDLLSRVPWGKFFLLWFLAVLMGTSLLWLNFGFEERFFTYWAMLVVGTGLGLLWGTTRPRWQKAHCTWCMNRVAAKAMRYDKAQKVWVMVYECEKCGHITEKTKP
jgi:hypothetical protein